MSEYKPEDLEREHLAEIEARVRATICPTFGSVERGGPPVETRQGRILADDFEALLRYAQAGAQAMRDLDARTVEAFNWNACCAALRASAMNYIKQKFTTASTGDAERELLERATIFYKEAGQNFIDRLSKAEARVKGLESALWKIYNSAHVHSLLKIEAAAALQVKP